MKSFNKLGALLLMIVFINTTAWALRIDNFIFIGDSLSDQGNCNLSPFQIPPPVTNGNTYTYHLGQKFNRSAKASSQGGLNFACVAGSTGFHSTFFPNIEKSGLDQVNELLSKRPSFSAHDLAFYWMGANDIILAPPVSGGFFSFYPTFDAQISANNAAVALSRLHQAGARYIVVLNLPPLEQTPLGKNSGIPEVYAAESRAYNQALLNRLNNMGFEVIQIDLFHIFSALLKNPSPFGITNIDTPCKDNPSTCASSFFFDQEHPTDKVHSMLADALYSILVAPDFYASLAEAPLAIIQGQNAAIRQQLYPLQSDRKLGKIYPFVGGDVNFNNKNAISSDRISFDSNNGSMTIGALSQINDKFLLGAAATQTLTKTNYDTIGSGFKINSTTLALFGSFQQEKFYANTVLNYGKLHFYDIERQFIIGPQILSSTGETEGTQYGASLAGGYNIINHDDLQFGPILSVDYQNLFINGYNELGGDVFDLVYGDQRNQSLIGSAGLQATFKNRIINNTPITTNLFATLNKEFLGGERPIYFRQASIAANLASLPVFEPEYMFATAGINFAIKLEHNIVATLGYALSIGEDAMRSNLITVGLTAPLD